MKRVDTNGALATADGHLFFDDAEAIAVGGSFGYYVEPPAGFSRATVDISAHGITLALRPGRGHTAGIDWSINRTKHDGTDDYRHPGTYTGWSGIPFGAANNNDFGSLQMVMEMQKHSGGWVGHMAGFYNRAQSVTDGWGFGGDYYDFEGRFVTDSPKGIWLACANATVAQNFISIRAVGYR